MLTSIDELREEVYEEVLKEINDEIIKKENEYNHLEKQRIKKILLNDLCFFTNESPDEQGYNDMINEIYPKQDKLKKEIQDLEYRLAKLKEQKRHLKGKK